MLQPEAITSILEPDESHQRTQALRDLLAELKAHADRDIPSSVREFLETYETDDQTQAVLIGLILNELQHGRATSIDVLARVFPGLLMSWEPHLQELAFGLLGRKSPEEAYAEISNVFGDTTASETAKHYAYNVLSSINYDQVSDLRPRG